MKCPICFTDYEQAKTGRTKRYCSIKCKDEMSNRIRKQKYQKAKFCIFCHQKFEWKPYLKYCKPRCKQLAQNKKNREKRNISNCTICGNQAIGCIGRQRKYCSFECQLKGIYGGKPPLSERSRKAQRNMRERTAPGLTYLEIRALRIKWQKMGRKCEYCQGCFDTIDHIVPLTRGGDNMLTNLVPCCRSCNSSKGTKLLPEWKPDLYASR